MTLIRLAFALFLLIALMVTREASAQVLDKQQQLEAQTFWDNRDWDWYAEQIPFFECPDVDITTTYYYRWELLTKTYEDGQFAGDSHGRELIGYVPWQFHMLSNDISRNTLAQWHLL